MISTVQRERVLAPPLDVLKPFRPYIPLLIAMVALLALFALWVPQWRFLTADNLIDLTQQVSVNAILAFGLTLVILIGGIDLSVGAVVAFTGVVAVSALGAIGGVSGVAVALAVATLLGYANGVAVN